MVILIGGLLVVEQYTSKPTRLRLWVIGAFSFVGVLFRETALMIPVIFCVAGIPFCGAFFRSPRDVIKRFRWAITLPLICGSAALLLTHALADQVNTYSFIREAISYLYQKSIVSYAHGWFVVFGPMLVILLYGWRDARALLARESHLLVLLLIVSVLAWVGGTDTERMLFWSAPVVLLLIGKVIEGNRILFSNKLFWGVLIGLQVWVARWMWVIPAPEEADTHAWPWLTVIGNNANYYDLWSYLTYPPVGFASFSQYLVVVGGLFAWLVYLRSKLI